MKKAKQYKIIEIDAIQIPEDKMIIEFRNLKDFLYLCCDEMFIFKKDTALYFYSASANIIGCYNLKENEQIPLEVENGN